MLPLETNLQTIRQLATEKENEHDLFRSFLNNQNSGQIDELVFRLNNTITPLVDCTKCGQCCKTLMINVTQDEAENLAANLEVQLSELKEKYIEESLQGALIMKSIPCPFLGGTSCTIYENRFTECREFPHLHKPGFTNRLFGTLIHYSICPIIFNVVENLKHDTGFTG